MGSLDAKSKSRALLSRIVSSWTNYYSSILRQSFRSSSPLAPGTIGDTRLVTCEQVPCSGLQTHDLQQPRCLVQTQARNCLVMASQTLPLLDAVDHEAFLTSFTRPDWSLNAAVASKLASVSLLLYAMTLGNRQQRPHTDVQCL